MGGEEVEVRVKNLEGLLLAEKMFAGETKTSDRRFSFD